MKVYKNGKLAYVIINGIKYLISNAKPVAPPEDIPVTSVSISNKISSLIQNTTQQLNVNVLPSNATDKSLTYTSSNTSIATVSNTGFITAKSVGSCTITVKSNNDITDTMNLTVSSATISVTGVTVSPTNGTLYPNQTTKLTATILPSNATNKNVIWTSLNTSIATVDASGNVTAKAIGNVSIRCTTVDGGFTANYSLTVNEQVTNIPVSSISITPDNSNIKIGQTLQLTATVLPSNATNKNVTWTSGDSSILSVTDAGLVTAIREGTTRVYIYAQDGSGVIGESMITVTNESVEPPIQTLNAFLPYVSIYEYKYRAYDNEDVIIPFYITDKDQKEYKENDNSLNFTIRIELDGNVNYIRNAKAGDHTYNFGKLSSGEHWFSIQVIDEQGLESHRLFNDILILNHLTYDPTPAQIYTITDADLNRHKINKNNSKVEVDMTDTRVGLTALFAEIKANGYKKCVLPQGTYRINKAERLGTGTTTPVRVPDRFTIDFNNSILKQHEYSDLTYNPVADWKPSNLMLLYENCYDSHVNNIILEGDSVERDSNGWLDYISSLKYYNGEHCNCVGIYGGKFCSINNVIMRNTTGYGVISHNSTIVNKVNIPATWLQNVAIVNGVETVSEGLSTCDFVDITTLLPKKYVCFSRWLGFGGMSTNSWYLDIHFYDENKNFIRTIKGHEYRRTRIVDGAKYVRATFIGIITTGNQLTCHYMETPQYFVFNNFASVDTRTCAFAPSQFNNMLLKDCTFNNCAGHSKTPTPIAIDLEDGWEQSQDFIMVNCEVVKSAGTRDYLAIRGFNSVMSNCRNFLSEFMGGFTGFVVNNNSVTKTLRANRGEPRFSSYHRIIDSTINGILSPGVDENVNFIVKNCTINGTISSATGLTPNLDKVKVFNCVLNELNGIGFYIKDSVINSTAKYLQDMKVYDSNFNCKEGLTTNVFEINKATANIYFRGNTHNKISHFYAGNGFSRGIFEYEILNDETKITTNGTNTIGDIKYNYCTFKKKVTINTNATSYVQFNNCTFEGGKVYQGNASTNCQFNNCIG